jgi:hypothetical protein
MRPVWLARPRSPPAGPSAGCEVTTRSATGVPAIGFLPLTIGVGQVKDCLGESLRGFLGQVVSGIADLAVGAGPVKWAAWAGYCKRSALRFINVNHRGSRGGRT